MNFKTMIDRKTLLTIVPYSDRSIYNMEKEGRFPRRIALGARKVVWDLQEVEAWIESRKQSGDKIQSPGTKPFVKAA
ncbi:AlpA family phage regulatory protein [Leeia sp. TBRC 13508]|uniref:AlpA family phage regulatory protein n=1 Tax=Leeia speluncae TaxID=2884804 RepID=A0ABS8D7T4_9NEIS|nr:AlpA family phage regulatory protein [Leeia speluncae]MCB6184249.1 AlpA family phage regulatory protein [Leeia speluncae]